MSGFPLASAKIFKSDERISLIIPDRKTETAAAWMQTHGEVEIVSRDRGEDYAEARRLGAPQARQVADRFHLTENLVEIVEVVLARCRAEIRRASQPEPKPATPLPEEQPPLPSALDWRPVHPRSQEHARLAHHAQRYDRYRTVAGPAQRGTDQQRHRSPSRDERPDRSPTF